MGGGGRGGKLRKVGLRWTMRFECNSFPFEDEKRFYHHRLSRIFRFQGFIQKARGKASTGSEGSFFQLTDV